MPSRRHFLLAAAGLALTPALARCAASRPAPAFLANAPARRPDALRLACHLFMSVSTGPVEASANTIAGALRGQFFRESTIDELDTAAAVRRAIVRAAAEIGRSAS